jgi:hypothetical protein
LTQDFIPEYFNTQITNYNSDLFQSQYIVDYNSNMVNFKTLAAIIYYNNHYTIYRRNNDQTHWIYIDSLTSSFGTKRDFPINLKNVYALLLEII